MSMWDLRQVIEAAIPAWAGLVAIALALLVALYGIVTRGRRR